ncbi:MAG TPA: Crp/Fnr family transcriptional regulator [Chitinophagales bacterium]|nr:Crp/Fnr family transcriptional regulator [Chitinophagales bacterium]HND83842.1 Crp/Fnr family transcriptional regulator [Chitinophagales bacterium]HRG35353.1 Crp/Fnr family transcriptional regulator [Chitinophagales bacterium]
MLKTNESFLSYLSALYERQSRKEDIILKRCGKGQRILSQNEIATKVMLIVEGISKCYFTEDNDKEYIIEFLGKGEIIGELELIRNIPCLCTIEAMTAVSYFAIDKPYFSSLLQTDIHLNHLLLDSFAKRIVDTASRAAYQQLYTVEHSLNKLMELQSIQNVSLSKDEMASYLGITVRSLNRAMKNLRE